VARLLAIVAAVLALCAAPAAAECGRLVAPEVSDDCAAILATVEHAGLYLPGNFQFRCPDTTYSFGVTGWNGTTGWVSLNLVNLRAFELSVEFTLAHETCHAWQIATTGTTTEAAADECAEAHGFTLHGGYG
jgi:hypothetical protein